MFVLHLNQYVLKTIINDFFGLLYPRLCVICKASLFGFEADICTSCDYKMPKTHFLSSSDNPVARLFWGRANICFASACYYYFKGGIVQSLIHEIKYKGKPEIGNTIGCKYGRELKRSNKIGCVDYIVPVPLHKLRQKSRGYNQSIDFAKGLSKSLGAKIETRNLIRLTNSTTQTKKTRLDRWYNVVDIFKIQKKELFKHKHILIVDDVITSGATLEACTIAMQDIPGIKISVLGIAVAV